MHAESFIPLHVADTTCKPPAVPFATHSSCRCPWFYSAGLLVRNDDWDSADNGEMRLSDLNEHISTDDRCLGGFYFQRLPDGSGSLFAQPSGYYCNNLVERAISDGAGKIYLQYIFLTFTRPTACSTLPGPGFLRDFCHGGGESSLGSSAHQREVY